MNEHDAITKAWHDYHGPIHMEGVEDYFPALPPLFKRGFLYGVEYAKRERDEARMQYRTTELLGMALVKTIDELKAEKAAIFAQLVSLQAGSRRATLEEIAESVREKYDPEHEGEGMEND